MAVAVEVEPFRGRGLLRSERAILRLVCPTARRIGRHERDFWEDLPPDLVRQAMVRCLGGGGRSSAILDGERGLDPACRLSGQWLWFEHMLDAITARVVVEHMLALIASPGGEVMLNLHDQVEQPATADDVEAATFEAALLELCRFFFAEPALCALRRCGVPPCGRPAGHGTIWKGSKPALPH